MAGMTKPPDMPDIPVPVSISDLVIMIERMERQAVAIARLTEQRDQLLRLVENMQAAAGVEGASDPIEALMRLREKAALAGKEDRG